MYWNRFEISDATGGHIIRWGDLAEISFDSDPGLDGGG